jgi:hypothetical protein
VRGGGNLGLFVDKAAENRAKYPSVAKVVDEVREYFPGAKVVAIREMSAEKRRLIEQYERTGPQRP